MDRRASLLSLATSLPLLLLVALVSLGRARPAPGAPPALTPTVPEATPGAGPAASLPQRPSPQALMTAAPAGGIATPAPVPSPTPAEPQPTATATCTLPPTHTPSPTPTPPSPAASILRITALEYAGSDEYVEITNLGPLDEVMTGWQLSSGGQKTPYTFPSGYTLAPGATVRVHSGRDAVDNPPADLKWSGSYLWNNSGDEARLYDAAGNLVDSWPY